MPHMSVLNKYQIHQEISKLQLYQFPCSCWLEQETERNCPHLNTSLINIYYIYYIDLQCMKFTYSQLESS
jgi:hypothetical protein